MEPLTKSQGLQSRVQGLQSDLKSLQPGTGGLYLVLPYCGNIASIISLTGHRPLRGRCPNHYKRTHKFNIDWGKGTDDHILPLGISFFFPSLLSTRVCECGRMEIRLSVPSTILFASSNFFFLIHFFHLDSKKFHKDLKREL